ncbi:hypothetical protein [Cryphonectria naterciae splipalmivirus 1]|uniref:Hypothetical protein protein n=1 Tax=Cryphonectria naterciae splipalmivirus 1 TaxID=2841740 RepID=A0A8J9WUE7_9VIRU|nr:hypothetical protein [Cryphonectria naterciae splipalmivirus 1]
MCDHVSDHDKPPWGLIHDNWAVVVSILSVSCRPKENCEVLADLERVRSSNNLGLRPWWNLVKEVLDLHRSKFSSAN